MSQPIRAVLLRTLARLLALLFPPSGHRRRPTAVRVRAERATTAQRRPLVHAVAQTPRTASGLRLLVRPTDPPTVVPTAARSPRHRPTRPRGPRSPYAAHAHTPIDATLTAPVRPYVVAHERERARQRRRRVALVLAADFGVDLDRHLVGSAEGCPVERRAVA